MVHLGSYVWQGDKIYIEYTENGRIKRLPPSELTMNEARIDPLKTPSGIKIEFNPVPIRDALREAEKLGGDIIVKTRWGSYIIWSFRSKDNSEVEPMRTNTCYPMRERPRRTKDWASERRVVGDNLLPMTSGRTMPLERVEHFCDCLMDEGSEEIARFTESLGGKYFVKNSLRNVWELYRIKKSTS